MPGLSASFDDAVPLMASLGDGELHARVTGKWRE